MPEVKRDSIPLSDEAAIQTLVDDLALKPVLDPAKEANRARSTSARLHADHWSHLGDPFLPIDLPIALRPSRRNAEPKQLWQTYFHPFLPRQVWHKGEDIWLRADTSDGLLRRVVISGLKDEREARALRLESTHHRTSDEGLEEVVARVVSDTEREARERHRTFLSALTNVRNYFQWKDGEVVEGEGVFTGLPVSKLDLPADDVEVLRQVFVRLREKSFRPTDRVNIKEGVCPTCGGGQRKRTVVKDLKAAREKVKEHGGEFADDGFNSWADQCLQTKTEKWSRAKSPLYEHYREWMRKGGHGGNKGEKAEAKATALSEVKWGRLMRKRFPFPDAQRRDKRSILYKVTLKREA